MRLKYVPFFNAGQAMHNTIIYQIIVEAIVVTLYYYGEWHVWLRLDLGMLL